MGTMLQRRVSKSRRRGLSRGLQTPGVQEVVRSGGNDILIVEDDDDFRQVLSDYLREELNVGVVTASDGISGVDLCLKHKPKVMILDLMLPRLSGFMVMDRVMRRDNPPGIIVATALNGKRHKAYSEGLGVRAYLEKPFRLETVLSEVKRVLQVTEV